MRCLWATAWTAAVGHTVSPRVGHAVNPRVHGVRMDAHAWREAEVNELNLLPFGLDEALLPGETKQVCGLRFSRKWAHPLS